jgi:hypothetical protein
MKFASASLTLLRRTIGCNAQPILVGSISYFNRWPFTVICESSCSSWSCKTFGL